MSGISLYVLRGFFSKITPGYYNPAATVSQLVLRRLDVPSIVAYVVVQFFGAFLGAVLFRALVSDFIFVDYFISSYMSADAGSISRSQGFFLDVILSSIICLSYLAEINHSDHLRIPACWLCYVQGFGVDYPGLIKHCEETTRDEHADFRLGRSRIDQVLIVRRVIEIWQRCTKPMQIALPNFEVVLNSPHQCCALTDRVPRKFVCLLDDVSQRRTAAVRRMYKTVSGGNWSKTKGSGITLPQLQFNSATDGIKRRTVDQCLSDIVLTPSGCFLTDIEYADVVVTFIQALRNSIVLLTLYRS
ncbi:hypothetical protein RB195_020048 [Necator americanus]|uniref:Aquaporin n=1 Tax=Necator americanus TaxID=51031 RepID=A0ABR1CJ56_NECAM